MSNNDFQSYFDQLANLLRFAEDNAAKPLDGPIDPELTQRLARLKLLVEKFKDVTAEALDTQGLDPALVFKRFKENPNLYTPRQQRLIKQAAQMGMNAALMNKALQKVSEKGGGLRKRDVGKNTKKSIQKRRGKFKGMGGDKKWKRL